MPALGLGAHRAIADPTNEVLISVAALWELTIKTSSGRLSLPDDLETMVGSQGFLVLSITFPHLRRLVDLPRLPSRRQSDRHLHVLPSIFRSRFEGDFGGMPFIASAGARDGCSMLAN